MKKTGCLLGIYGLILPSYVRIIINHYKDPYSTTSFDKLGVTKKGLQTQAWFQWIQGETMKDKTQSRKHLQT